VTRRDIGNLSQGALLRCDPLERQIALRTSLLRDPQRSRVVLGVRLIEQLRRGPSPNVERNSRSRRLAKLPVAAAARTRVNSRHGASERLARFRPKRSKHLPESGFAHPSEIL
jgi:hypothetical protein